MATRLDVNLLPLFDLVANPTLLSQHWKSWKQQLEMYFGHPQNHRQQAETCSTAVSSRAGEAGDF